MSLATVLVLSFLASAQVESIGTEPSDLSTLLNKTCKYSARPPLGEFERPATAIQSQADREQRQIREALGKGFYFFGRPVADPGRKVVNGQVETINLTFIDSVKILKPGQKPDPPGLPISSTAIVKATVGQGQAFVSEDRTDVYSDYLVRVDQVLKPDPGQAILAGSAIIIWRRGGSIHFPSGHIKHFIIGGYGFPEIETQYVFFLVRSDPRIREYEIEIAYALKNGLVLPLDVAADYAKFERVKAADFLDTLEKAIAESADSCEGDQGSCWSGFAGASIGASVTRTVANMATQQRGCN